LYKTDALVSKIIPIQHPSFSAIKNNPFYSRGLILASSFSGAITTLFLFPAYFPASLIDQQQPPVMPDNAKGIAHPVFGEWWGQDVQTKYVWRFARSELASIA
jgi:hypothetical protein